eukprot:6898507-Prymnesium_polylepis.1
MPSMVCRWAGRQVTRPPRGAPLARGHGATSQGYEVSKWCMSAEWACGIVNAKNALTDHRVHTEAVPVVTA